MKHSVSETQICTNMAFKLSSENRNIKSSDNVTIYKKNLKGDTHGQANMDGTIDIDKSIQQKINYLILALKKIGTTVIVFGDTYDDVAVNFSKNYIIYNKSLQER